MPLLKTGPYGYTDDMRAVEAVREYVEAAIADGWSARPSYKGEPQESAATLERDGFKMHTIARVRTIEPYMRRNTPRYTAEVSIWGPDGAGVEPPPDYSFEAIQAGVRACPECGRTGVDTVRVAFANRACTDCAPALTAKLCKPGWCN